MLQDEEKFGIKDFKTYKDFGKKVYKILDMSLKDFDREWSRPE